MKANFLMWVPFFLNMLGEVSAQPTSGPSPSVEIQPAETGTCKEGNTPATIHETRGKGERLVILNRPKVANLYDPKDFIRDGVFDPGWAKLSCSHWYWRSDYYDLTKDPCPQVSKDAFDMAKAEMENIICHASIGTCGSPGVFDSLGIPALSCSINVAVEDIEVVPLYNTEFPDVPVQVTCRTTRLTIKRQVFLHGQCGDAGGW